MSRRRSAGPSSGARRSSSAKASSTAAAAAGISAILAAWSVSAMRAAKRMICQGWPSRPISTTSA